jgi:ATP-dependent DNA helicase RecQ
MDDNRPVNADILESARSLLTRHFGHASFLRGQEEPLKSVFLNKNILVVMPTGSGKSLIYQLPALTGKGLTIVVSPLISLMKDQVDELTRKGIPATFINSSLPAHEQRARLARCLDGKVRLLYVAPERLRNDSFVGALQRLKIARIAVDEAHCISQWGHDFRPDYRRIKEFRVKMNSPLVTALTATATPVVQRDIVESLGLKPDDVEVHVHGFARPNLRLKVLKTFSEEEKNLILREMITRENGSGIIYAGTRKLTEAVAEMARTIEPNTAIYHAGMEAPDRTAAQERFLSGKARIVVATTAFGMGIDKPAVRFVAHYNCPGSIEQYYQEIGRAGRDGKASQCTLLFMPSDRKLRMFFIDLAYPEPGLVKRVYEALWAIKDNPVMMTYGDIAALCGQDVKDGHVGSAIRLLDGTVIRRGLGGEPRAGITWTEHASRLLPKVRGNVMLRALGALATFIDKHAPGRHDVPLNELSSAAGLTNQQVRRSLAAMAGDGLIEYDPPFRGAGVQKLVKQPPPFHKLPIDWPRQNLLRKAEEEKLAAMMAYVEHEGCRAEYILHYFGEQAPHHCGTCDHCDEEREPSTPAPAPAPAPKPETPPMEDDRLAGLILTCVKHLRFPLGKTRIAETLTGSRSKKVLQFGLAENPAYGKAGAKGVAVIEAIEELIRQGFLRRTGEKMRPVLELTQRGMARAAEAEQVDSSYAPRNPARHGTKEPAHQAGSEKLALELRIEEILDSTIDELTTASAERAKSILPQARMFNPREIARRLASAFSSSRDPRLQSRAVWLAGELCGLHALDFLLRCASSDEANIRRLAAAAIGKVMGDTPGNIRGTDSQVSQAREALAKLQNDPAPQVRQYASKALNEIRPR